MRNTNFLLNPRKEMPSLGRHLITLRMLCMVILFGFSLALKAQITIQVKNTPLRAALKSVERASDYKFFYSESLVGLNQNVTVDVKDSTIDTVMKQLLNNLALDYKKEQNGVIVLINKESSNGNKLKKVTGLIIDQSGEAIIGASVQVKGKDSGTITDVDGNFSLTDVEESATLIISYIGYKTVQIEASDKRITKITLQEDSEMIEEVVVVGYGTVKKRDVTTSISSISAKDMEDQPVTNIGEAMVGRMPGVQVTQGSGTPGGGLQIRVRGTGTITAGTTPLYVVDGVPMGENQLNTLNMNDVESIEVLKDASSAAIYGSRGSNGVVIISTKRGKEGRPIVSYSGYVGVQTVAKKIDMLNAYEYAELVRDARNNSYADKMRQINNVRISKGLEPISYSFSDSNATRLANTHYNLNTGLSAGNGSGGILEAIIPNEILPYLNGEQGLTDTDWQDEIFRNALMQNQTLSVRGGTEKVKYYASVDYLQQEGVLLNTGFDRFSGRFNLDVTEGRFKFGLAINPSFTNQKRSASDGQANVSSPASAGVISSALHAAPIFSVYDNNGAYSFAQNNWSADAVTTLIDGKTRNGHNQTQVWNPVALANLRSDETEATRVFGNIYAEAKILNNLNYRLSVGLDHYSTYRETFVPNTFPQSNTAGNPAWGNEATSRTARKTNWLMEHTLNYKNTFGAHSFDVLGGWTMQQESEKSNYMFANDFISNSIPTLNAGVVKRGNSQASEWSLMSFLTRVQYDYLGRYLLSAAFRTDGASRFGANNKWGAFPSVSAGWRISEENFMQPTSSWLDDLKLRASYGLTGNFQIPNYGAHGEMDYVSYVIGGEVVKGVAPTSMPNPDLGWEKTSQVNVGFDLSAFRGKLTVGLDLYNSNTYDLLLNVPVSATTGYSTRLENIGEVNNKGIEFSVGSNWQLNKLKLGVIGNISKNVNKVVALGPGNADIIATGTVNNAYFITRVGEPIASYYLPVVEGVFKTQEEVDNSLHYIDPSGLATTQPGDFKFKDVNGDGILDITDTDRAIVGNYMPDFTYGFSVNAEWKGFDLGVVMQGVYGNEILNLSRRYFYNHEGNMNNYAGAVDRWKSEADPGSGWNVRANRAGKGLNGTTSTWHVEDGSYFRIKNITLGYTLPKLVAQKVQMQSVRVYVSAQNLFTFSKYEGYNPEVTNRTTTTTLGEDYGVYPLAKVFTLGLNINF